MANLKKNHIESDDKEIKELEEYLDDLINLLEKEEKLLQELLDMLIELKMNLLVIQNKEFIQNCLININCNKSKLNKNIQIIEEKNFKIKIKNKMEKTHNEELNDNINETKELLKNLKQRKIALKNSKLLLKILNN